MSKLAKKPIQISEGTTFKQEGKRLTIIGPLGEMSLTLSERIEVEIKPDSLKVNRLAEDKKALSEQGTFVRLISNGILGTRSGFSKILEIVGTGFKVLPEGSGIVLSLGFSHPVHFKAPEGIKLEILENNKIKVFGIDKEKVGLVADQIKKIKKPDPYKGKGIRYFGEKLKLKPGKAAAKAATATTK